MRVQAAPSLFISLLILLNPGVLSLQLMHLLAGDLAVKPTPLALFRNKREHALTAPLFPPGSHPWGSSCDQVASLLGLALSLPVTPAQERPLNCRDHRDHTGQTDLSWARDEWAHFCTGGDHPSLRPGNSVPFASSHAAHVRGAHGPITSGLIRDWVAGHAIFVFPRLIRPLSPM